MAVAILVAIPLGIVAAVFRGTAVDHAAMTLALVGISMPNFWLGPLLAILFAVRARLAAGFRNGDVPRTWCCRRSRSGAALAAILARMTRASVIEELRELYVLAARARGVSRTRAVVRHAFRNSLIPIVTIIGLQFGAVLTGTIITETIFAWPGVGRLLIQAINFRDYPLVQGCILFISFTYVDDEPADRPDLRLARSADPASMMIRARHRDRRRSPSGAALAGPVLTPYRPVRAGARPAPRAPSLAHPFGLDELGRDILSRIVSGARISLLVGLAVVSVSSIVGMLLGSMAGYFGGGMDDVISRVMDVLMAFPGILLAIALVAVLGPSLDERRAGAVGDRLGGLRAPGARAGAACARARVRPGGARARRRLAAHRPPPRPADRAARRSWCRPRWAWRARSSRRRR